MSHYHIHRKQGGKRERRGKTMKKNGEREEDSEGR